MSFKRIKVSKPELEKETDDAKVRMQVEAILKEVETNGDQAIRALSEKFDSYSPSQFKLTQSEIESALQKVSARDMEDIKFAQAQIRKFA